MRDWFPKDWSHVAGQPPHNAADRVFRAYVSRAISHGIRPRWRDGSTARFTGAPGPLQPANPHRRRRDIALLSGKRQRTRRMFPRGRTPAPQSHILIGAPATLAPPDERRYRDADGLITICVSCHRMQRPGTDDWDAVPEWETSPPDQVTGGLCALCFQQQYARYLPKRDDDAA